MKFRGSEKNHSAAQQPVIILGMHRSGTSIVARCLEQLGLFLGRQKDRNHEAWLFQRLNNWMLAQTNASWDRPENFLCLNALLRHQLLRVVDFHLRFFPSRVSFLGWRLGLCSHDFRDLDFPWGWKDPRNTFTADIWNSIFPDAKFVQVQRHPVDVALSLQKREQAERQITESGARKTARNRIKEILLRGVVPYQKSVRVEQLSQGVALWLEYEQQAMALEKEFGDRMLKIKFEDFLIRPETGLQTAAAFAGLKTGPAEIKRAVQSVNPERAFAFAKSPELVTFFESVARHHPLVKMRGYDRDYQNPETIISSD
ncbi:MAG TPA: sulfotransferase [bacterium]|nr:sulfotransferase [bacterium]